ncbi:hypothetical protein KL933_001605 [Ogataea haglerorum]|uniref:Uncharacterized protein n=1 Tax=Ogataea haglerorum TaxID=1937702 RepID=A0AAN6D8C5_9ASCO|nr:hypothetical protein KL951_002562 [Ogataea haglerorum]KAG7719898.1 hypothetical protein KL913_001867 [Ogataea haglerorum]KAG7721745.1 hypothetical protein KL949_001477 [Ogataea haglerorum]KAG7729379.1 hypothetical protein KL933_001605 [Ogataea haglerorum]KAG7732041.1 hypothetical protein KL948_002239 [Ogataea haglerorum]
MLSCKNSSTYPTTALGNGAREITCSRHILDTSGNIPPTCSANDTIELYVSGKTYEFPQSGTTWGPGLVSAPQGLPVVCLTGKCDDDQSATLGQLTEPMSNILRPLQTRFLIRNTRCSYVRMVITRNLAMARIHSARLPAPVT